jgi:hypothetical protein
LYGTEQDPGIEIQLHIINQDDRIRPIFAKKQQKKYMTFSLHSNLQGKIFCNSARQNLQNNLKQQKASCKNFKTTKTM